MTSFVRSVVALCGRRRIICVSWHAQFGCRIGGGSVSRTDAGYCRSVWFTVRGLGVVFSLAHIDLRAPTRAYGLTDCLMVRFGVLRGCLDELARDSDFSDVASAGAGTVPYSALPVAAQLSALESERGCSRFVQLRCVG